MSRSVEDGRYGRLMAATVQLSMLDCTYLVSGKRL